MSNGQTPTLPLELQRMIFEMAVSRRCMKVCVNLMLVAKYVREWMKPIMYSVFPQSSWSITYPDFNKYPSLRLEEIGPFAKHLMLAGQIQPEDIKRFLLSCPNIHNLALWVATGSLYVINPLLYLLPLQRLSVDLDALALSADDYAGAFSSITHLDVIGFESRTWTNSWSVMATLPRLTHLSINFIVEINVIQKLLRHCTTLRVLIILRESGPSWYHGGPFILELTQIADVRLVLIEEHDYIDNIQDWIDGAYGNLDTWLFSEYISLARHRKYLLNNSQSWVSRSTRLPDLLTVEGREWLSTFPSFKS